MTLRHLNAGGTVHAVEERQRAEEERLSCRTAAAASMTSHGSDADRYQTEPPVQNLMEGGKEWDVPVEGLRRPTQAEELSAKVAAANGRWGDCWPACCSSVRDVDARTRP